MSQSVPQGFVLGTTLFAIHVNDMGLAADGASLRFYADDTVVIQIHCMLALNVIQTHVSYLIGTQWQN